LRLRLISIALHRISQSLARFEFRGGCGFILRRGCRLVPRGTTLILRRHKRNGQYAEHYGWERPQHCCADGKIAIFGFHFSPSSDPLWILQQTDHLHSHF